VEARSAVVSSKAFTIHWRSWENSRVSPVARGEPSSVPHNVRYQSAVGASGHLEGQRVAYPTQASAYMRIEWG
jgi:hypothetical protein